MICFSFSHTERRRTRRFSWHFLSQGSAPDSKRLASESSLESPTRNLQQSSSQRPPDLRIFSYNELRAATKNFSRANLLGEGGFGCVHKGLVRHRDSYGSETHMEVAVKQLNRKGRQGHKEWLAEVRFLGMVEHPNLVKLVGYCAEDDESGLQRLLVYEYMANRSLEVHLFQRETFVLPWEARLRILLGAALGLAYLHEDMDIQVIFRDFKTSNILLDHNFVPKLSDFGMAREGPEMGATHVSTAVVGTRGYAAPEYIQTGHLTSKSDVWSFGVVMLEMLSGRRSIDRNRPKNEQHLIDWIKPNLHANRKIPNIMDPRLEGKYSLSQAQKVASLARQCLVKNQKARPLMSVIVEKLKEIVESDEHGSQQSDLISPSISNSRESVNANETKESSSTMRRLLFKDVISLRNKEDARLMWQVWAPKPVQV